ncbi:HlyD family efflux transporter periplasmic adaptor subunit [Bradyrhizobium australiense]|uniref:HlyD family efflux transporter periplasmic adaptor subunit n=1 Tax=Bradyrhizobium australiense TaxID=2721161 RepID=A0A7Y4GU77_9BRAD|nr:HlyD family efflux transporter periplasmic adaptor subunit [Bradyrhizobium australiense]NOJ41824.1 HlyD family efflux transporter periplasmic adaptor subunit [Bradyrhizobium australiense]
MSNPSSGRRNPAILRVSAIGVAGLLSALMVTAVAPPIVADQSDRAVVNAPVTLLTAPIGGEIDALTALPGSDVRDGDRLAQISNPRVDRGTLISLEEKSSDARQKLDATRAKGDSDRAYVASLDAELASQAQQLKMQFQSQIEELRARVAQSNAQSGEKKALVERQSNMVTRNAASMDMLRPTTQQFSAALHNADAEGAKLNQKIAQLDALSKGIYVGDELIALNNLAQKRRDIDLDAKRMEIEEKQQSAVLADLERLIDAEQKRLASLAEADVRSRGPGKVLTMGAAMGRHVNAGDTISSIVDCDKRFVVAIFSYRQGQTMMPGTRVRIDGSSFRSGVVSAVLPKTSDKVDERFAVPFPQTERRELYAMITPDGANATGAQAQETQTSDTSTCPVGQWVTVTRDNGIVPSMSVSWRRIGNLVASWTHEDSRNPDTAQNHPVDANTRRAGMARLQAASRSPVPQALKADEDWWSRTRALVSR